MTDVERCHRPQALEPRNVGQIRKGPFVPALLSHQKRRRFWVEEITLSMEVKILLLAPLAPIVSSTDLYIGTLDASADLLEMSSVEVNKRHGGNHYPPL